MSANLYRWVTWNTLYYLNRERYMIVYVCGIQLDESNLSGYFRYTRHMFHNKLTHVLKINVFLMTQAKRPILDSLFTHIHMYIIIDKIYTYNVLLVYYYRGGGGGNFSIKNKKTWFENLISKDDPGGNYLLKIRVCHEIYLCYLKINWEPRSGQRWAEELA